MCLLSFYFQLKFLKKHLHKLFCLSLQKFKLSFKLDFVAPNYCLLAHLFFNSHLSGRNGTQVTIFKTLLSYGTVFYPFNGNTTAIHKAEAGFTCKKVEKTSTGLVITIMKCIHQQGCPYRKQCLPVWNATLQQLLTASSRKQ